MTNSSTKPNSEEELAIKISDYLSTQYPDILFHFDYGSGLKMTMNQARRQKRLNKHRGFPDLFIAFSREVIDEDDMIRRMSHGLFIELKKAGTKLQKRNGEWATPHIAEQAEMLKKLKKAGYMAKFGMGFKRVKTIIDEYLGKRR